MVLVQGHYLSYLPLCSRNEPVFVATCTPIAMPETRECVVQGATNVFTTIHSMDMRVAHIDKKWVLKVYVLWPWVTRSLFRRLSTNFLDFAKREALKWFTTRTCSVVGISREGAYGYLCVSKKHPTARSFFLLIFLGYSAAELSLWASWSKCYRFKMV